MGNPTPETARYISKSTGFFAKRVASASNMSKSIFFSSPTLQCLNFVVSDTWPLFSPYQYVSRIRYHGGCLRLSDHLYTRLK